jgi:ribosomal protein S18 acetylase RimI-like enzyme
MKIIKAKIEDLPSILSLQKLCFQSEAQMLNDFSIQPLTQTLESITEEFNKGIILKAVDEKNIDEIIGSVRGYVCEGTLHIGKLIVNPSFQNKGVGKALLSSIESMYPNKRYELFTSGKSVKNLNLYIKNGYSEYKQESLNEHTNFVFFEKNSISY